MSIQPDTIISMAVGAIVTAIVAHLYYVRAADDMKKETKRVHNLLRIALQGMEDAGMVKLNWDSAGEIIGMTHFVSMNAVSTFHATAELSVLNEVEEEKNDSGPESISEGGLHVSGYSDHLQQDSAKNG
jgi:hypothetical protein